MLSVAEVQGTEVDEGHAQDSEELLEKLGPV